jgi:predicted phage replisome organizer
MSGIPWIKIRTDIFSDEKIRLIEALPEADSILIVWIKLLTLAGMVNMNGEIFVNDELPYTDEMLATIFNRRVNTVRLALKTFEKFRMIEILGDKTIVICNWGKHQNLEGLDKIRQQTAERMKRYRDRRLEQRLMLRDANATPCDTMRHSNNAEADALSNGDVTRDVTVRKVVTQSCVAERNQIKSESKKETKKGETPLFLLPPAVPQRGTAENFSLNDKENTDQDVIQQAEAKYILGQLSRDIFGHETQWPDDMDHWLDQALPVKREDLELVRWFYGLPASHKIFTVTRRRQSMAALVQNLVSEVQKIRSAMGLLGMLPKKNRIVKNKCAEEGEQAREVNRRTVLKKRVANGWTREWVTMVRACYPRDRIESLLSKPFWEVEEAVRKEADRWIDRRVAGHRAVAYGWTPERIAMARRCYAIERVNRLLSKPFDYVPSDVREKIVKRT